MSSSPIFCEKEMDIDSLKMPPPPPRPARPSHIRNSHSLSAITKYSLSLLPNMSFFKSSEETQAHGLSEKDVKEDGTTEPSQEEIGLATSPGLVHTPTTARPTYKGQNSMDALVFPTKARPSIAMSSATTTIAESVHPIPPRERVQSVTSLYRHVENRQGEQTHERLQSVTSIEYSRERVHSVASYYPYTSSHSRQHLSTITNVSSPMHRKSQSVSSTPLTNDCPPAIPTRRQSNRKRILRANPKALSTYAPGLSQPSSRTNSFTNLDDIARTQLDHKRARTYSTTDEMGRQVREIRDSNPSSPVLTAPTPRIDDSWSAKWKRWSGYGFQTETSWRRSVELSPDLNVTSRRNSTISLPTEPGYAPYVPTQPSPAESDGESEDDNDRYWKAY